MKKSFSKLSFVTCLLVLLISGIFATSASAAKPYMKNANVTWDLKPRKQITYKNRYGGIGLRDEYAKIISYKKTSVGNKYKLKLKIRFECIRTLEEMAYYDRDTFLKYSDDEGLLGDYNVAVVDYMTGKSLFSYNRYGVSVKHDFHTYRTEYFHSSDWRYEEGFVNSYATVTITYPKSYKNLCIGIGGSNCYWGSTDEDDDFYEGYGKFKQTSFWSNESNKIMHFMRVK